ncbi:MAG: hypothetical protein L0Z62_48375 [Gemmataceae bacterium]|nr:hypothetical protein [Gemmataceae bacterium]
MSEQAYDAELRRLEAALATLTPRVDTLDRDRLMFQAGQASVPRRGWLWPCTSAALAAVSVALGGMLLRPGPRIVEHVVYLPRPEAAPLPAPLVETARTDPDPGATASAESEGWPTDNAYFRLQQHLFRWGLDGLPPPSPALPPEPLEAFLKSL